MRWQASARPRGFILVMVLAMLVVLSLLATTIGTIAQRLRDEALDRQRQFRDELDMADTRAGVLYLLTSQRMTFAGLTLDDRVVLSADEQVLARGDDVVRSLMPVGNEIALDGTAYRGNGRAQFALQDDRGLLGVNWVSPLLVDRLFEQAGVPFAQRSALGNLLLDYQDPDDLYRINGAERDDYRKAERPPPSNRTLATPLELRRIIGWDQALAGFDDADVMSTFTVARSPALNVNTAPARVLHTLLGIDEAAAQRIVAARRLAPLIDLSALYQIVGNIPPEFEMLSLYPANSGTLRLWSADGSAVRLIHWTLTPIDDGGKPWREDYEFTLARTQPADGAVARPTQTAIFAEPVPAP